MSNRTERRGLRSAIIACVVAIAACALPVAAQAAAVSAPSQIWWTNYESEGSPNAVVHAFLDGSSPTALPLVAPEPAGPWGGALDLANGRVFWFDYDSPGKPIWRANLDGTGQVKLGDTNVLDPYGITYDQASNRIYFGQYTSASQNTIFWMSGDGTGQTAQVLYQGANARKPWLTTVDPSSDRVYWANYTAPYTIGWTSRDGSSSGEIAQDASGGCAELGSDFWAYTVLPQRGKILWFSNDADEVRETGIDGSNCRVLTTTNGRTDGLAFDPRTNNVYYFDGTVGALNYFNLDNPSAAGVITLPMEVAGSSAQFPMIAAAPTANAVSLAKSGSGAATTLTCSASWYPGIPAANFYSAPASGTTYAWMRDGVAIAGQTAATLTADANGTYTCVASASNSIGVGAAESNAVTLADVPAKPVAAPAPRAPLPVRVPAAQAKSGLAVTSNGMLTLPLACPSGVVGSCDASGTVTITLPSALRARAAQTRLVARFKGVRIASGQTRLYAVRLDAKTFSALRRAGVTRVRATLHIENALAGGTPVITNQRVWLRIPPLQTKPSAVTG